MRQLLVIGLLLLVLSLNALTANSQEILQLNITAKLQKGNVVTTLLEQPYSYSITPDNKLPSINTSIITKLGDSGTISVGYFECTDKTKIFAPLRLDYIKKVSDAHTDKIVSIVYSLEGYDGDWITRQSEYASLEKCGYVSPLNKIKLESKIDIDIDKLSTSYERKQQHNGYILILHIDASKKQI